MKETGCRSATGEERKRGGLGRRRLTLQCISEKVSRADGAFLSEDCPSGESLCHGWPLADSGLGSVLTVVTLGKSLTFGSFSLLICKMGVISMIFLKNNGILYVILLV